MLRKILSAILCCIISGTAYSQSIDEKIGSAMNASDWFALDSLYSVTPKDSIHPFLEVFSRCLIGNRLNRTDISIPAFQELLNKHSLDVSNLVSSVYMYGMDLSREGYNAEAASMIRAIVDQTKQYLDSASVKGWTVTAAHYDALAEYKPYQISFPHNSSVAIPFSIVPVGPKDKGSMLMHLCNSSINGQPADITFDTGAGMNMISPEMAEKYGLTALDDAQQLVFGVGQRMGSVAIAKELKLGDLVVRDVPFVVVSLSSGNEEADQYTECFNIVVGSELMLQLKDLTIDFEKRQIEIPANAPVSSDAKPNMCFSSGMNLLVKGLINNTPATVCIDSGDAAFGTLSSEYYERFKDYVERVGRPDTIRSAGIAGVTIMPCYYMPEMPVAIGGTTVLPDGLVIRAQNSSSPMAHDVVIGLRTLMMFGKLRFNMVDFVLTTEPYSSFTTMVQRKYDVPAFKYSKVEGPTVLQTLGFIGVAVARTLIYPTAANNPDL